MPTIAQNLETIKNGIDDIKENLGLSQNASLANVVTKSESVIEPTGTISITQNGTVDVTNYASANVNVSGGGGSTDFTEYFNDGITGGTSASQGRTNGVMKLIKKIPVSIHPTSNTMGYALAYMSELIEAPLIDFTNVTSINSLFANCSKLEIVPVYNWSSITTMNATFQGCSVLSDTSIDNILQSCISATLYTGTKTLSTLGFVSASQPSYKIQACSHYQDFVNAGWSIGY